MKKTLAVLLAVLLTLGMCPAFAFAAGAKAYKVDYTKPPVILIDGINAVKLIRNIGTKEEKTAFPFESDDVVELVKSHANELWDMLDGDYSAENEASVLDGVNGLLEDIAMNDDGTSKYDVTADWFYPGEERPAYIGEEEQQGFDISGKLGDLKNWFHSLFRREPEELTEEELRIKMLENRSTYKFQYDWRLDPFEIAEQLHEYVEFMKEFTGFDTVTLVGFSEGAAMLNTYLTVYGYEGLESVIWLCGAQNGVELVGQLFTGRISVDAQALTEYVRDNGGTKSSDELLADVLKGFKTIGITGNVLEYTNKIIDALLEDGGIRTVIRRTFAKMPAVWSLIGDDYYEEAKAYVFNEPGDAETFATLLETIDRYHYEVQAHSAEIMANAKAATGKIGVVAKYGLRVTPLIENSDIQSDGVIDVKSTSCGATAAPYGRTLGDGYVQAMADGHDHLSSDGMIDASTALYPDYTWFFKNLQHSSLPDCVYELMDFIAHADGQVTVFDDARFPQFQVYSPIDGETAPLKGDGSQNAFLRAMLRVKMFFRDLMNRIRDFFGIKDEDD